MAQSWFSRMRVRLVIKTSLVRSLSGPHNIFSLEIDHEIFPTVIPSVDSSRAVVRFLRKNVHKYWLTAKRTKPAQEKCG